MAEPLTREAIVTTAITLADREGLDAVSIRRIAAQLSARPMSLYRFVDSKHALLLAMQDVVVAEAHVDDDLPDDWRAALRVVAAATARASSAHPWLGAARAQAPGRTPAMDRHIEQSLRAVAGLGADPGTAREVLVAIDTYVIGHATIAQTERAMDEHGRDEIDEWRAEHQWPDLHDAFDRGLEWLLDGIQASVHGRTAMSSPSSGVRPTSRS